MRGTSGGAWAEYAAAREVRLVPKPANVSFEEAAAVPVAGITALQALRDHARAGPGQKVLRGREPQARGRQALRVSRIADALRYWAKGHARGKIVVTV